MVCTRCEGTGFLNVQQLPDELLGSGVEDWHTLILNWIKNNIGHDVSICDCCGNTEEWYGEPGDHNFNDFGKDGPYAYNGGLPECN